MLAKPIILPPATKPSCCSNDKGQSDEQKSKGKKTRPERIVTFNYSSLCVVCFPPRCTPILPSNIPFSFLLLFVYVSEYRRDLEYKPNKYEKLSNNFNDNILKLVPTPSSTNKWNKINMEKQSHKSNPGRLPHLFEFEYTPKMSSDIHWQIEKFTGPCHSSPPHSPPRLQIATNTQTNRKIAWEYDEMNLAANNEKKSIVHD